jgi:GNAT superfamily N-acetyltransferase
MIFKIEYQPGNLSFDEFQRVDAECFHLEPINQLTFANFSSQDFWAAYDSTRLVGYSYAVRKPDVSWLSRICVSETYRRKGIASSLLQMVIDHAGEIGLPDLLLYVQSDNLPAIQLYEQFRFQIIETAYQFKLVDRQNIFSIQRSELITAVPITEVEKSRWPEFLPEWMNITELHRPPEEYVLLFFNSSGENQGYCRLTPHFPGCFPFVVKQPFANLIPVLQALHPYQLPNKDDLMLTFSDEDLADACRQSGLKLNYQLYKMFRRGNPK